MAFTSTTQKQVWEVHERLTGRTGSCFICSLCASGQGFSKEVYGAIKEVMCQPILYLSRLGRGQGISCVEKKG